MFIDKTDFESSIHTEIIDSITRNNDLLVFTAINEAVGLAMGYLTRYNVNAIFTKTGEQRDPVLLMICKDIAIYNMHSINNAIKMPKVREDRYNAAIKWLEEVQNENINPPGFPITTVEGGKSISYGSNAKRECHF